MKLNPNLEDWWTEKKRTDLRLSEDRISGAGISVKVVLNKVLNENINLYSYEGGTHEDNLYILIINKESSLDKQLPKILRKKNESRLGEWFGEPIQIKEFVINKKGMKLLQIEEEEEFLDIKNQDVKYNLYFHDNFILSLSPTNDKIILNLIERIKYLHNFYLDKEIRVADFEERIYNLLKTKKSISIYSNQGDGKLSVEYKIKSKNILKRIFNFQDKKKIIFD